MDGEVFIDETEVSEDSDEERGVSCEEVNVGPAAHTGDNDVGGRTAPARWAPQRNANWAAAKETKAARFPSGARPYAVAAGGGATGSPVRGSRRIELPTVRTREWASASVVLETKGGSKCRTGSGEGENGRSSASRDTCQAEGARGDKRRSGR